MLRGRRSGYLSLVLLVGLVGGLALGSVAVARRTQSSFATYLASTNPSDLAITVFGGVGSGAAPAELLGLGDPSPRPAPRASPMSRRPFRSPSPPWPATAPPGSNAVDSVQPPGERRRPLLRPGSAGRHDGTHVPTLGGQTRSMMTALAARPDERPCRGQRSPTASTTNRQQNESGFGTARGPSPSALPSHAGRAGPVEQRRRRGRHRPPIRRSSFFTPALGRAIVADGGQGSRRHRLRSADSTTGAEPCPWSSTSSSLRSPPGNTYGFHATKAVAGRRWTGR